VVSCVLFPPVTELVVIDDFLHAVVNNSAEIRISDPVSRFRFMGIRDMLKTTYKIV